MPMDKYSIVIIGSFLGFIALAALLLVPVYLFLKKEEAVGEAMTAAILEERKARRAESGEASTQESAAASMPESPGDQSRESTSDTTLT
jgi:hypothetical protein